MDVCTYIIFQSAEVFHWTCPRCVAEIMPFHDCSILSSSSSDTSESVSQCDFDLPCLSSPAGLRIAHLNCRSLLSIADEVFDLFTHNHMDIVAVTETWLDPLNDDSEIFPYSSSINIVRNDCNRHGGGVAFLFSSRVKLVVRPDLCKGHVESIWVEVFPKTKRSMLFCCVYHPPSQFCFFDKFLAECESDLLQCPQITILGDMNADLLKPSCVQTKSLLSVMKQLQLVDLVNAPTRVTMTSSTEIDVLMSTDV